MKLIGLSLLTGFIGIVIASIIDGLTEIYTFLIVSIGILSPSLYVLEKIYRKEIKDRSN